MCQSYGESGATWTPSFAAPATTASGRRLSISMT